jgi:hypothetical protein
MRLSRQDRAPPYGQVVERKWRAGDARNNDRVSLDETLPEVSRLFISALEFAIIVRFRTVFIRGEGAFVEEGSRCEEEKQGLV